MKTRRITAYFLSLLLCLMLMFEICPALEATALSTRTISEITITDLSVPRPGTNPDYQVTYGTGYSSTKKFDSADTQINGIVWSYKRISTFKVLKATDTFTENIEYTVAIVVHANIGYSFKTNGESPAVACYVNGNRANATGITGENNSNTLVIVYTFPACEYFTINFVGINKIDIPQTGSTADFTADTVSERYTVSSISWYDNTARKSLSEEDTFAANHSYTLEIYVRAKSGSKLQTDSDDLPDFSAEINGDEAELIYAQTNGGIAAGIRMTYSTNSIISKISVSDIEIPKAGNRADYTCNIDGTGYELDTYGIDWTKNSGYGTELPIEEEFKAGQSYELKIWLKAKDGFSFKTNTDGEVIADVKINGRDGDVYISDSKYCQIIYVYTVPQDITSVGITGITEPIAGEAADYTAEAAGKGYEISKIEWYDSTDGYGNYIYNITSFSEGREYTLNITLNTVSNYSFELDPDYLIPDISAKINGKSARVYSEGGKDEAIIFLKYKTPVETVAVTGIDAPVVGATPDTEALSTKAGYKIAKTEWYDTTVKPNRKLSATDKFIEGHKYTVQITLYATDDFIFCVEDGYQDITGTINGKNAIEYGSHEYGTADIGYEFNHAHTLSDWKADKNGHFKECTQNACNEIIITKTPHSDSNSDGKCDTCNYSLNAVPSELILKTGCAYSISHTEKTVTVPEKTKASEIKANIVNKYFSLITNKNETADDNAFSGTGTKVQITDEADSVLSEYTVIVLGDVDGNGEIQSADARLALRASVSLEKIEGVYKIAADTDNNNELTATDARTILRKSVGLE